MSKQILCESPVIILHPYARDYIMKLKSYKLRDIIHHLTPSELDNYYIEFPYFKFSVKKLNITLDELDDQYIFNKSTGETFPLYLAVPCSKCVLCRDKKAREWSFRAACENSTATTEPLFLTLTYNPKHLPENGVFKEEIQLFMKRLRRSLDRKNYTHNLRYFACAEYGTKSKRPHYHLILWNFPEMNTMYQKLKFVENAWKIPTGKYRKDGSPITSSLGFALCVPCRTGAISYVMKYMRKPATIPEGKNDVFFLSSRKNGGIGAEYARKMKPFYLKNPAVLDMSVYDPYANKQFNSSIPAYYKRLFYPSHSQIVKQSDRENHKKLLHLLIKQDYIYTQILGHSRYTLSPELKTVLKKFSFHRKYRRVSFHRNNYFSYLKNVSRETLFNIQNRISNEIDILIRELSLSQFDEHYIKIRPKLLEKRTSSLSAHYDSLSDVNIFDKKMGIINKINSVTLKEKI